MSVHRDWIICFQAQMLIGSLNVGLLPSLQFHSSPINFFKASPYMSTVIGCFASRTHADIFPKVD